MPYSSTPIFFMVFREVQPHFSQSLVSQRIWRMFDLGEQIDFFTKLAILEYLYIFL